MRTWGRTIIAARNWNKDHPILTLTAGGYATHSLNMLVNKWRKRHHWSDMDDPIMNAHFTAPISLDGPEGQDIPLPQPTTALKYGVNFVRKSGQDYYYPRLLDVQKKWYQAQRSLVVVPGSHLTVYNDFEVNMFDLVSQQKQAGTPLDKFQGVALKMVFPYSARESQGVNLAAEEGDYDYLSDSEWYEKAAKEKGMARSALLRGDGVEETRMVVARGRAVARQGKRIRDGARQLDMKRACGASDACALVWDSALLHQGATSSAAKQVPIQSRDLTNVFLPPLLVPETFLFEEAEHRLDQATGQFLPSTTGWRAHLKEQGYIVIRDALDDANHALEGLLQDIQNMNPVATDNGEV